MKKRELTTIALVSLMLFLVFAVASVSAEYPAGMVSYWKFDEGSGTTAFDSVATNDGTLDEPVWTTGIVGSALSFDGEDDYVEVQHNDNLNADLSFTVEAWIKLNSVGSYQTIVTKHHENWINGWQLVVTDNDIIQWDPINNAGHHQLLYGNTVLQKDVWYHVAGVLDDPNQRLYVNGVLDAEKLYSGIPITNSKTLEIGYSNYYRSYYSQPYYTHTTHWFFNGLIDEVAIYNRALSAEEIQQHYQNGLDGLGYEKLVVPATIDIDPNTLNLKSNGKLVTAYIEIPEGYDVSNIDVDTVMLNDQVQAESHPTEIGDYDDDGIADLMVKFDRAAVQKILEVGDEVEIIVTGELVDSTLFEGSDTIRVIDIGKGE